MDESKSKIIVSGQGEEKIKLSESLEKKRTFVYDSSLVPMTISDDRLDHLDSRMVSKKFYNNFNFSKLPQSLNKMNISLGITSANSKEGKTLVASNMAVSLAKAYRQKTVLVDLNFKNPNLHKVFGAQLQPGLAEAMQNRMLRVTPTMVDDLFLLSAGDCKQYEPGIKDTMALREILYTLKSEFDFIIVDMAAVFPFEEFPVHFINEIDGLITVVDAQNTRQEHLDKIYKHVDEKRFIGYIFNRVK
jgi:Mrp family chromosome partitioning ATPase